MSPREIAVDTLDDLRLGHPQESAILGAHERQLQAVIDVQAAVKESDWPALRLASLECLGLGDVSLDYLHALTDSRTDRRAIARDRQLEVTKRLIAIVQSEGAEALLDRLPGVLSDEGRARIEESVALLADGITEGVPLLQRFDPERAVPFDLRRQLLALANLCRARGLMGLVQAEFQARYQSLQEGDPPVHPKQMTAALKSRRERFEQALRAGQRVLRDLLAAGAEPDEIRDHAGTLCSWIRRSVVRFCRSQAEGLRAAEQLLEGGAGGAAEALGAELANSGFATREAISTYLATGRVTVELREPGAPNLVLAVLRADHEAFDFSLEDGKNTALAHLLETEDGKLVDVEGFVEDMHVTRLGGQLLVSEIVMKDPSSGVMESAAAVFVNAPNSGITRGSYCRVTGRFRKASNLMGDRPGVEVERLDLTKASQTSWRLAFLRLADPWFHLWRNSLGLRWSLGPHAPDGATPATLKGAAEIIFLPLVRMEDLT